MGRIFFICCHSFETNIFLTLCIFVYIKVPYTIITLIAQFGNNIENYVNSYSTSIPALFAKTSSIYNPLIFIYKNKECRNYIKAKIDAFLNRKQSQKIFLANASYLEFKSKIQWSQLLKDPILYIELQVTIFKFVTIISFVRFYIIFWNKTIFVPLVFFGDSFKTKFKPFNRLLSFLMNE